MSKIIFKSAYQAVGYSYENTYYWYHSGCLSRIDEYLLDEAKIRCNHCGKYKYNSLIQDFNVQKEIMNLKNLI